MILIYQNKNNKDITTEELRQICEQVPYKESRKVFIVLFLGFIGSAMLLYYAHASPDNNSILGSTLPVIFKYLGLLKYLFISIPFELAFKYYEKNYYHKHCSLRKYKVRPILIVILIRKFILTVNKLIKILRLKRENSK